MTLAETFPAAKDAVYFIQQPSLSSSHHQSQPSSYYSPPRPVSFFRTFFCLSNSQQWFARSKTILYILFRYQPYHHHQYLTSQCIPQSQPNHWAVGSRVGTVPTREPTVLVYQFVRNLDRWTQPSWFSDSLSRVTRYVLPNDAFPLNFFLICQDCHRSVLVLLRWVLKGFWEHELLEKNQCLQCMPFLLWCMWSPPFGKHFCKLANYF